MGTEGSTRHGAERGDLFGARFELFADVLGIGLAAAVACLPLVTIPAALSTACTLLGRRMLYAEPSTAGRYFGLLRRRLTRAGEWASGAVLVAGGAVLAADAGLVTAGLPGAVPFAFMLALVATAAAVIGLRACGQSGLGDPSPGGPTDASVQGSAEGFPEGPSPWGAALRAAAARSVRDLPGSGLVLLALCTAAVCAWTLPPVLFLLPGPLALALTAVELRRKRAR